MQIRSPQFQARTRWFNVLASTRPLVSPYHHTLRCRYARSGIRRHYEPHNAESPSHFTYTKGSRGHELYICRFVVHRLWVPNCTWRILYVLLDYGSVRVERCSPGYSDTQTQIHRQNIAEDTMDSPRTFYARSTPFRRCVSRRCCSRHVEKRIPASWSTLSQELALSTRSPPWNQCSFVQGTSRHVILDNLSSSVNDAVSRLAVPCQTTPTIIVSKQTAILPTITACIRPLIDTRGP